MSRAQATAAPRLTDSCGSPRRVLFVCTGNTCRSPMAAALLNHSALTQAGEGVPTLVAASAGLYACPGDPITPAAADALREGGVLPTVGNAYTSHCARGVSEALLEEADEVFGITASHAMELVMRYPQYASKISPFPVNVSDPFGGDAAVYRDCLTQLRYGLALLFPGEL